MDIADIIVPDRVTEPTWARALQLVQKRVIVPSQVRKLVRSGWGNLPLDRDLLGYIAQSSVGAGFIFDAAQPEILGTSPNVISAEQAIDSLGTKLLATVIAVNYTCKCVLRYNPPRLWEKLFREMMTSMEIGSKLGARIPRIGIEGGLLVGFARPAGFALLMVEHPKEFRRWYNAGGPEQDSQKQIDLFGCEVYQVASFVLQQLGFGSNVSMGAALGQGPIAAKHLEFQSDVLHWKAATLWTEALVHGRSYPGELSARNYFPELRVQPGKKNTLLEVLYTEVARVRGKGSEWTWHLPKPGYAETAAYIEERSKRKKP